MRYSMRNVPLVLVSSAREPQKYHTLSTGGRGMEKVPCAPTEVLGVFPQGVSVELH